jgi:hypothetical protein
MVGQPASHLDALDKLLKTVSTIEKFTGKQLNL